MHLDILNGAPADAREEIIAAEYVEHATALFAPHASGKVHGPTVVRETVNWLRAQFPDLQLTILAIVAGDDIVAGRVHSRGTNLGKLGGAFLHRQPGDPSAPEQSHWLRRAMKPVAGKFTFLSVATTAGLLRPATAAAAASAKGPVEVIPYSFSR